MTLPKAFLRSCRRSGGRRRPFLRKVESIATLLEKRLDYLHRSDAEMSALGQKLMHTRPYRPLLQPPSL